MELTEADYLQGLQALLPHGPAWSTDDSAMVTRMLGALAAEMARVDARVRRLIDEADPRTTGELLLDWERVAGLPDTCVAQSGQIQSAAQRRAALVARLTSIGGQSASYYVALAGSLGYTVTITEYKPFKAGASRSGDIVGQAWAFAWAVNAPTSTVTPFRAGQAVAGDAINGWGNKLLECVLSKFKPAHTSVVFKYA